MSENNKSWNSKFSNYSEDKNKLTRSSDFGKMKKPSKRKPKGLEGQDKTKIFKTERYSG